MLASRRRQPVPDRKPPHTPELVHIALTQWVLRAALRQWKQWEQAGLALTVSVNVSALDIQDAEFPGQVASLLDEFAVPPRHLELEITESAVMSEPVRAVACIQKLDALGLQIAIDDFGTGYSSMKYLKELLVGKIKIDRSFEGHGGAAPRRGDRALDGGPRPQPGSQGRGRRRRGPGGLGPAQGLSHRDDGFRDRTILGVVRHFADERTVDLQRVDREALEPA